MGTVDYQKVTTFLQNKKSSLRTYEANNIDTLLSHLSGQNVMVFEMDDSLDVIICDLSTYRNESIPGYSNTFYKAYFPMNNGTVTDGLIYTIHTNYLKLRLTLT